MGLNRVVVIVAVVLVMAAAQPIYAAAAITRTSPAHAATTATTAPAPSDEAPGLTEPAVYIDQAGQVLPEDEFGMPIDNPNILGTSPESGAVTLALGACTPFSGRDYPHISKNGTDVSGHGWWDRGDCSGSLADVYNCIYEYYDDGFWYQKDCSSTERLSPGGGAGNRTNARRVCANFHLATWRNHVDVDVVGEWDTGENPMRQATINCQVF